MTRNEALQFLTDHLDVWPAWAQYGPVLPGYYWVDCENDPPYLSGGDDMWPIDVSEWARIRNGPELVEMNEARTSLRSKFNEVAGTELDLRIDGGKYIDTKTLVAFKWFALGVAVGGRQ